MLDQWKADFEETVCFWGGGVAKCLLALFATSNRSLKTQKDSQKTFPNSGFNLLGKPDAVRGGVQEGIMINLALNLL